MADPSHRHVPPDCPLTPTQFEVVTLRCEGMSMDALALHLGIKASTVRTHVHQAFKRLGVANTAEMMAKFYQSGWYGYVAPPLHTKQDGRAAPPLGPWHRAYLYELDQWLSTGKARHWKGMKLAALGMVNDRGAVRGPGAGRGGRVGGARKGTGATGGAGAGHGGGTGATEA